MTRDVSHHEAERIDDDEATSDNAPDEANSASSSNLQPHTSNRRRKRIKKKKKRRPGLVKKLEFITHLLQTLDLVVFAELSALYYMECSMFRFLLRALSQVLYLTPKHQSFPFHTPAGRVLTLLVVVPNIICLLLHLFGSLPTGPEFHRGYQHGGVVIDFIGQKPPPYRLYYLLVDVVILVLQCLMLTVHTQREKLRLRLNTFRPLIPELALEMPPPRSSEDLDAEERGVVRADTMDETESIELQSLHFSQRGMPSPELAESSRTQQVPEGNVAAASLLDILSSGNAVLGEYHIVQSLSSAALDLDRTAAQSLRTISYGATMAALRAQQRGTATQSRSQPSTD
ncbi:hypothetical protein CDD82_4047 [Ophiocordyceps australis]|uniref:DUF1746 domain-containing protein n=1 Tax=Ophiocordyceps australis TaxID=1399860 RepID=A0A2C5YE10_9HYPO|nr:hypothetical protein CDD82_4047 [Ophiocordyceps australis]